MIELDLLEESSVAAMEAQRFCQRSRAVIRTEERLAVARCRFVSLAHVARREQGVHGKLRLCREKPGVREPCERLETHVAHGLRPKRLPHRFRRLHDGEKLPDLLFQRKVCGKERCAHETCAQVPLLAAFRLRQVLSRLLALVHIKGRLRHDGIGVCVFRRELQDLLRRSAHAAKVALVRESVGDPYPILFIVHKTHAPTNAVYTSGHSSSPYSLRKIF